MSNNIAYLVRWTEIEVGWGDRPDGYSLHISAEVAAKYVKDEHDSLPAQRPHEYSQAEGPAVAVEVTPALMEKLQQKKAKGPQGSLRFWHRALKVEQTLTGTRKVSEVDDVTTMSFLEQCVKKKAKPADVDAFIAKWQAGDKAIALKEALGTTDDELTLIQANSANVFRVLYERENRT